MKATAPASLSRPNSVISRPASPLVMAAAGRTLTLAVSRARRSTKSTMAGSSITGLVSGMQTSVVTPPAAAAALAEARVSRCSAPGSPTKARISISPGVSTRPAQSTRFASAGAPGAAPAAMSAMRPSRTSTAPAVSRPVSGSRRLAFARR